MPTVNQATWGLLRALGVRKVFGNPGSTEMPFLADFPDDIDYLLGLHEGAVVGMADVYAQLTGATHPGSACTPRWAVRPRWLCKRSLLVDGSSGIERDLNKHAIFRPVDAKVVGSKDEARAGCSVMTWKRWPASRASTDMAAAFAGVETIYHPGRGAPTCDRRRPLIDNDDGPRRCQIASAAASFMDRTPAMLTINSR